MDVTLFSPNSITTFVRYMIENGHSAASIAEMRDGLDVEGWRDDERLPEGWKLKIKMSREKGKVRGRKFIMAFDGTLLESVNAAVKYMKERSSEHTESEISNLLALNNCQEANSRKKAKLDPETKMLGKGDIKNKKENINWEEGESLPKKSVNSSEAKKIEASWKVHPKLPEGWMMKVGDADRILFLTPDKRRMSLIATIRYMKMSPDFRAKDIVALQQIGDEVKPKTIAKGEPVDHSVWRSHPKLPFGWQIRLTGQSFKLLFRPTEKSPGMGKFAAIKCIKSLATNKYEAADIDGIKMVAEELEDDIIDLLVNSKHKEVDRDERELVEETIWISDDPTVPAGWKISPDSGRFGRALLSPAGVQMRNRAWALSQMVKKKQPVEEVDAMRESLVHEGWSTRSDLPPGWRVRVGSNGNHKNQMDFMTPVGKWFPSLSSAKAHMEKLGECTFDFSSLKLNLQNEKKTNALKENSVAKDASQMEVETESQLLTDASEKISTQDAEKAMMVELNASCWQNSNKNSASVEKRNQIDNAEQVVKERTIL